MSLSKLCVSERVVYTGVAKALFSVLAMFLLCAPLFSQSNQGRILGSVRDQSGGSIAGATVTVTDTLKGVSRTLTTDEVGDYAAPNLDPSTYSVRVEFKGFKTFTREGMVVGVGSEAKVDVVMQPGEQTQTVTVTEDVPLVETTSATLTGNITTEKIADLPLNGRNFVNLLTLRPGFVNQPGGGGGNQSSMGLRPGDSMFLLDGLNLYEWGQGSQLLNGYAPAGDAATLLPIDSIQDFNIQQDPKAEVGWKPGVAINIGLKSGTNSLHGTAYAFGRDGSWDALNFFNPQGSAPPSLAFEQYGATAGGPVLKDKLFWYVGYEAQLINLGQISAIIEPVDKSIGDPALSMVDACTAVNAAHAANAAMYPQLSPLSATLAGLNPATCQVTPASGSFENVFPYNPGTQFAGVAQQVIPTGADAFENVNNTYNGLAKVDYHPNDKSTLSGMFFIGDGAGTYNDNPSAIASYFYESLFPVNARVGSGSWTYVPNSSIVNEFKVGYTHYRLPFYSVDHNSNPAAPWGLSAGVPTGYDINTGVTDPDYFGFPTTKLSGFTQLGGNWPKIVGPNQNTEILDHISYLKGKHAFKFGGEYTYVETTSGATSSAKGRINFGSSGDCSAFNPAGETKCTSLENYLFGIVSGNDKIFVGDAVRDVHTNHIAAFFQDDYRATARLTINIGVRYELGTIWADSANRLGNFDPNSPTGFVQVGDGITAPYNPDHRDWSPRVGFAWDIFGNQKTVLRAGVGLLYEFVPSSAFLNAGGNSLGLGKVPSGAEICLNGNCTAGTGTIAATTVAPLPSALTSGWQNNGPNTPIFNTIVACGDGSTVSTNPSNPVALQNTSPGACSTASFDRNLRVPYVETWNIDIQHSFTNNLSLDVAYLGNHGVKIYGTRDINAPPVGAGWGDPSNPLSPAGVCLASAGFSSCNPDRALEVGPYHSKFPYISYIDQLSNQDRSHYNALQVSLTQRTSHGLSFTAAYTYSHALDDASQNFGSSIPLNNALPDLNYGNSDYDIRNRFTFEATYAIPGRKSPAQLLQGWAINSIVTIQPGTPWAVQDTNSNNIDDFSGTGEGAGNPNAWGEAWDFYGNPKDFTASPTGIPYFGGTSNATCLAKASALGALAVASLTNSGCYASGNSVLIPPAYGTYGTVGRNIFLNPNFRTWDMSVTKEFKIKERMTAQFRAEFFNVLNHPVFGQVDSGHLTANDPSGAPTALGLANETPDAAAGNPVLGSGSNRDIQLGLKLIF
jgi:carboxypeptidase family protein